MIVREQEGSPKTPSGSSQSVNPSAVPQSLGYLSPDLQERLVLATANKLLTELKECLKAGNDDVENVVLKICAVNCSVTSKCRKLELWSIFHHNCKAPNDLARLQLCFSVLEKYGYNLLKSHDDRPSGWHAISVRNNSFSHKVDVIKGARDVLKHLGYSVETPDGLTFPTGHSPIVDDVVAILAEIIVVKSELDIYICCVHPYPKHWESLIPPQARIEQRVESDETGMAGAPRVTDFVQKFDTFLHRGKKSETPPSPGDEDICDLCGSVPPVVTCDVCESKRLCTSCDDTWHHHPRRRAHTRSAYAPRKKVPAFSYLASGDGKPTGGEYSYATAQQTPDVTQEEESDASGIYAEIPEQSLDGGFGTYEPVTVRKSPIPPASTPSLPPRPANLMKPHELAHNRGAWNQPNTAGDQTSSSRRQRESDIYQSCSADYDDYMRPVAKATPELPSPQTAAITKEISTGHQKIQQVIDDLKQLSNPAEKKRRAQVLVAEFSRKTDQYGEEIKQILKKSENYESDAEYKRLIGEKSRLERNRLLLNEFIREVDEELKQLDRALQEPPNYRAPRPNQTVDLEDIGIQLEPPDRSKFDFESEGVIPKMRANNIQQDYFDTHSDDVIELGVDVGAQMDEEWECEHCTMLNPVTSSRVCDMCAKTSVNPKRFQKKPAPLARTLTSQSSPQFKKTYPSALPSSGEPQPSKPSQTKPFEYSSTKVAEEQDEIYFEKQRAKAEWERKQKGLPPLESEQKKQTTEAPHIAKSHTLPLEFTLLTEQPEFKPEPDYLRHTTVNRDRTRHRSEEVIMQERMTSDSRAVASVLNKAESRGHSVEDVEIALVHTQPNNVIHWIENDLPIMLINLLETVKPRLPANQGEGFHIEEAKRALIEAEGDFDLAVTICVARRQSLIDRLFQEIGACREEIIEALSAHGGDEQKACMEIQRAKFDALLNKIWETTSGGRDVTDGRSDFRGIETVMKNKQENFERRCRMVLVEAGLQGWGRAENVVRLVDENLAVTCAEVIHAVKDRGDIHNARAFLQQECCICYGDFPANQILTLSMCECRTCESCMRTHFEVNIKERHVKNLSCPNCQQPNIEDVSVETIYLEFLTTLLKRLLSEEVYRLYGEKLRDWQLQKDENFRWCSNCPNGFIFNPQGANPNRFKMTCEKCKTKTCFNCKKKWEDQHDNATCEEFKRWQEENDPEFQKEGLAKHLQENGIDCPQCKMKYSLAKGGCMHFKCPQCGHEFCCGCNQAFNHGSACKVHKDCAKAGLHCHHPRDCLYFLRDESIQHLQKLLQDNNVNFQMDNHDNEKCTVMEQKETPDGLKDDPCDREVEGNQAGLCTIHYKEYLVSEINRNHIDPIDSMQLNEILIVYRRHKAKEPKQKKNEAEKDYAARLKQDIKQKFPLPRQATG